MSKLFGYGESLEGKTEKIMQNCEGFMDLYMKANGFSIMDVIGSLDAETGAMIGEGMTLYKEVKNLAVMQAKALDRILEDFDELKEMNQKLREQNIEQQRMLQVLGRQIDSIKK